MRNQRRGYIGAQSPLTEAETVYVQRTTAAQIEAEKLRGYLRDMEDSLEARQYRIVLLLLAGYTRREAAEILGISKGCMDRQMVQIRGAARAILHR